MRRCPACGDEYRSHGSEDSEQLEIEVRAYRRVIKRRRYRRSCQCAAAPALSTAPAVPRLIPKGILGISIWVTVLIDKYLLYRPTYRLLADLRAHGLDWREQSLVSLGHLGIDEAHDIQLLGDLPERGQRTELNDLRLCRLRGRFAEALE